MGLACGIPGSLLLACLLGERGEDPLIDLQIVSRQCLCEDLVPEVGMEILTVAILSSQCDPELREVTLNMKTARGFLNKGISEGMAVVQATETLLNLMGIVKR